jgi:hypothetical protein
MMQFDHTGSSQTTEAQARNNRRMELEVKNHAGNYDFNPMPNHRPFIDKDPSGRALKEPGTKGDHGKSPVMQGVLQYFPRALLEIGRVSERGAEKYSWRGWEKVPNGKIRYGNALVRHIILEDIDGDFDSETGLLHAAQEAWNALARLELILREKENG